MQSLKFSVCFPLLIWAERLRQEGPLSPRTQSSGLRGKGKLFPCKLALQDPEHAASRGIGTASWIHGLRRACIQERLAVAEGLHLVRAAQGQQMLNSHVCNTLKHAPAYRDTSQC